MALVIGPAEVPAVDDDGGELPPQLRAEGDHYGDRNVWITRKGAVRARAGELGIIPGSMGAASFIVRGTRQPGQLLLSCSMALAA
jgi:RNA-splicing ligase RtcB